MDKNTLQSKIEQRAKDKENDIYREFVKFMENNELCKLLKFKKGDLIVPFCSNYNENPLFHTGVENKNKDADNYTNFNEARKQLLEKLIERETNELLKAIDDMADYFNAQPNF